MPMGGGGGGGGGAVAPPLATLLALDINFLVIW